MAEGTAEAPAPRNKAPLIWAVVVVAIMITMGVSVSAFRAGAEKDQFGQVLGEKSTTDGLLAEANITSVDPLKNEMQVRLALNPEGSYDDDGLLARPVTLYYDTLNGTKQVDFKAKKPLGSVDLTVPLVGDSVSSYPWDTYTAELELVFLTASTTGAVPAGPTTGSTTATTGVPATTVPPVSVPDDAEPGVTSSTAPTAPGGPATSVVPPAGDPGEEGAAGPAVQAVPGVRPVSLALGTSAQEGETKTASKEPDPSTFDVVVPISLTVYKTVPAYTVIDVEGSTSDGDGNEGVVSTSFTVKRTATAQAFSVAVSLVMWCLALGVLYLAISVITRKRKLELTHVSVMAVVMFALPAALRSFQPGVPPPGVLSDFYSFFWCAVIVGVSLILTLTTYVVRKPE